MILGRLLDVDAGTPVLSDEAAAHVRFADELSQRLKDGVDAYLERAGITPPPLEDDPADAPYPQADCVSPVCGLYFIGFPWLNSHKTGIIYGIEQDAGYVADAISEQLA